MPFTYPYPRPAVTTDCVVVRLKEGRKEVLLIRRLNEPFRNMWALPGGFMDMDEILENTARRELYEEAGIKAGALRFVGVYDRPGRDPRGRTISAVYLLTGGVELQGEKPGSDASETGWFEPDNLPPLAFDHAEIIGDALRMIEE